MPILSSTMTKKASRRLSVLLPHFETESIARETRIESENTAGKVHAPMSGERNVYASIDGKLNSYARIHGSVSSAKPRWTLFSTVQKENLQEVIYEKTVGEGIAKVCLKRKGGEEDQCAPLMHPNSRVLMTNYTCMQITINRPEKRNAFTPRTVHELSLCFSDARDDPAVGVIILTGSGSEAFCSGGDQSVRGKGGYVGTDGVPRLNVLDLQIQIRRLPKPVIAMVAGYAVGGGHILHMVCDLTVRTTVAHYVGYA